MGRLIFRNLIPALGLIVLLSLPSIASADGVTWTFSGVTFDDGGMVASGSSFFYDALSNKYDDISVTTTAGTLLTGATYTSLSSCCGSSDTGLALGPNVTDYTDTPLFFVLFSAPLTNAGGTIPLSFGFADTDFDSAEDFCTSPVCSGPSGFSMRLVTGGEVVGVASTAVPEPSAISLLIVGLIVLLVGSILRKVSCAQFSNIS
jgi:hypothetical protein